MPKSAQTSKIFLLTQKILDLEKRLSSLEKRVSALDEEDFSDELEHQYGYFGDDDSDPVEPEAVIPKKGRPPRISPEKFDKRRDELVHFLELRWPSLNTKLKKGKGKKSLWRALANASPGAESTSAYCQLTEHIEALQEFLQSGRYKREPRQIAYAMAGLPKQAWRTSFDYGTKNPSPLRITLSAFVDHIRRHNPKCWRALQAEGANAEPLPRAVLRCWTFNDICHEYRTTVVVSPMRFRDLAASRP